MKVLVQRVQSASVQVGGQVCGQIAKGMLLFVGIHKNDTPEVVQWMVKKVAALRIFADENGKMNLDVTAAGGKVLVVSQFTLYGNCLDSRRPEFTEVALPETAFLLYEEFHSELSRELSQPVQTGIFGANMQVSLINDGPITFILEK